MPGPHAAGYELYDLNNDPYEVNNIYKSAPKVGPLRLPCLAPPGRPAHAHTDIRV